MSESRRILKFDLPPSSVTAIATKDEPRFLAVGTQGTQVVVWVEATAGVGVRTLLAAVMTGEMPPEDGEYIGTTQINEVGRNIVVHFYRQLRP